MVRLSYSTILFFCLLMCSHCEETAKDRKIIIIGAGLSGIAAASKLLELGYEDITILEAENRIGGRIWSEHDGENILEYGSQWIMGETGNVLYEMAKKADIIHDKIENHQSMYFKSDGESISNATITSYWDTYKEIISKMSDKDDLISEIFEEHLKNLNLPETDKETQIKFFKLLVESITPVTDWSEASGKGLSTFKAIEGSSAISLKKGVDSLLYILMDTYPSMELNEKWKKIIHLGCDVRYINWDTPKPIVHYTDLADSHTKKIMEADYVIVTIPLGKLKHDYRTFFVPDLPEKKVSVIKSLSFGFANKVFLTFDHQWWPDSTDFYVIWKDEDAEALKVSDQWLPNIVGIFPADHYPNTLAIWVTEKDSICTEFIADDYFYSGLMKFLRKLFVNQTWNITDPVKTNRTRWHHDPNFYGGYSYPGVEASKTGIKNSDLRIPLKNTDGVSTVFFAGEATHDFYYSTMHGAVESGFNAAEDIHNSHK